MVWLLMMAMLFNSAFRLNSNASGKGTLMCTSVGYQWVSIDGKTTTADRTHCALCINVDQEQDALLVSQSVIVFDAFDTLRLIAAVPHFFSTETKRPKARAPPITL